MEQFSLDKYLENQSHKVVTRDGRPVRIVCWDLKCNTPIIAAIQWNQEREDCYCYNTIGKCANNVGELDLFFADEEDGLTELQKALEEDCDCYVNLYNDGKTREELREWIKCWCNSIIDLARKEILKDFPKWKKSNSFFNTGNKFELGKTSLRRFDGYEIPYSELENLPKEE